MRKIDADALLSEMLHSGKETVSWQEVRDFPTLDDTICEVNLAENAARICEILNADAEGKVADLVKVVRCKDCKYCATKGNHLRCECKIIGKVVNADSYCECGRRE